MANIWVASNNQISTYTYIINHARIMSAWFILPFCRSPICEVLSYRKIMHPPHRHEDVMFKSRMQQIVRIHDRCTITVSPLRDHRNYLKCKLTREKLIYLAYADVLLCSVMCRVCRHFVLSCSTFRRVYLGHEISSIDC